MAAARPRSAARWPAPACATFFVAVAAEGEALRDAVGPGPAIYVLGGYRARDAGALHAAHDLRPVLNSAEQARAWFEARPGAPAAVQVDTGMNRLGMEAGRVRRARAAARVPSAW